MLRRALGSVGLLTLLSQHAPAAMALSVASGAVPKADLRNVSPPASDTAAQAANPAKYPTGAPHTGSNPSSLRARHTPRRGSSAPRTA